MNSKNMIPTKEYILEIMRDSRYNAYGNFLDRFKSCGDNELRLLLIKDPPDNAKLYPVDAAKLAATVERLAKEYGLPVPEWTGDKAYILKEPYYGDATIPEYKKLLKDTALPEFAKRNLYLGANCMSRA